MPIPKTIRVNPLDLQKNIVIGIALPFNGVGVFNKTYSTKDQIKSNLLNLLLTNKGERIMNPDYGADLQSSLFEFVDTNNESSIREKILTAIYIYMPEITVTEVKVLSDVDTNTIYVVVNYYINISEDADQVTVQFT